MITINSKLDSSINIINDSLVSGYTEARYVRRQQSYFSLYLSSHNSCNRGCRFCHLTASGQTQNMTSVTLDGFLDQANSVYSEYDQKNDPANAVNYSWMSRGDALCNDTIINDSTKLFTELGQLALNRNLFPKFNISTIIPKSFNKSLSEIFPLITPTIYYSIYSVKSEFRKKWIPGAMNIDDSLNLLKDYQSKSRKLIKFHCAFISGENDSDQDIRDMMNKIDEYKIQGEFNIVRYNPYSSEYGKESDRLADIHYLISSYMPAKIVSRVGEDCYASCGTFYN